MTQFEKLSYFVTCLSSPLKEKLQSLHQMTFVYVFGANRPIEQEINQGNKKSNDHANQTLNYCREDLKRGPPFPRNPRMHLSPYLCQKVIQENLFLKCLDPNHWRKNFSKLF